MTHRDTHPERTSLAVHRTSAAILVISLTLLRMAAVRRSTPAVVVASAASLLGVLALLFARFAYRGEGPVIPFPRAAAAAASAVALVAIAGLWTAAAAP